VKWENLFSLKKAPEAASVVNKSDQTLPSNNDYNLEKQYTAKRFKKANKHDTGERKHPRSK